MNSLVPALSPGGLGSPRRPCQDRQRKRRGLALAIAAAIPWLMLLAQPAHAVELTVSRAALERTLVQQLFSGPDGHYYLKGNAHSACSVYAENPEVTFAADRVQVKVKIHAKLGTSVTGHCVGITLAPAAEVSMVPEAEGESIGFRDARVEHVSESRELNFLLMPFLSHQIPSGMKVNAADLLRRALASSTANSGYQVTLDRLKIHSLLIQGDDLVLDADGDLSVH